MAEVTRVPLQPIAKGSVLKLWLAVNHKPVVRDDSHGFWRRVRLIPFLWRFTDLDKDDELVDKLLAELPGILAWAVRGTVFWREEGLRTPPAVKLATETYRVESDPLGDFLEACCVVGEGLRAGASALYAAYRSWAQGEGMRDRDVLSTTLFGTRMTAQFAKQPTNSGKVYLGVGLRSERADGPPHRQSDGFGDGS